MLEVTELISQTFILEFSLKQKRSGDDTQTFNAVCWQRTLRFYQQNDLCAEFKSEEGQRRGIG